jgi:putative membrane protein insertion efficiency factor
MLEKFSLHLIGIYQRHIRIVLPESCRFSPSCSEYTRQAISKYGFFRGVSKGCARLLHCHPFSGKRVYDPLL